MRQPDLTTDHLVDELKEIIARQDEQLLAFLRERDEAEAEAYLRIRDDVRNISGLSRPLDSPARLPPRPSAPLVGWISPEPPAWQAWISTTLSRVDWVLVGKIAGAAVLAVSALVGVYFFLADVIGWTRVVILIVVVIAIAALCAED